MTDSHVKSRRSNRPSVPATSAAQVKPARRERGLKRIPSADQRQQGFSWRIVSLVLVLVLGGGLIFLFNSPMFVVRQAEIGSEGGALIYVPVEEVFAESGVAGQRIMTVDPEVVVERIERSPSIESAEVFVEWPAVVKIVVQERAPALIWEQQSQRYWVDLNGHLMVERRLVDNLLLVINEGQAIPFQCPGPLCADDEVSINPEVVQGAQHLKTLRTNIEILYYDPVRGLSYQDGRGWRAYFGIGATMDTRLIVYETLVARLEGEGIRPVYIDVSNPDAPYYRVSQ